MTSPDTPDLAQILADAREEAQVLRANGAGFAVDRVESLIEDVAARTEDARHWLSEEQAMLKSGLASRTLRLRFRWLRECKLARYGKRHRREYRADVVPQRTDSQAMYEEGRRSA
jgi:hypothetical protein